MARLKTVYILSIDNFGQPSGDITEVKMTQADNKIQLSAFL